MTNLDSILKSSDITLPLKVCTVKAMVFPVVMLGCESWTLKKAECWRIFFLIGEEFIRLGIESPFIRIELRVTARRSSQSFLKEINTEYSLEGLILLNCGVVEHS